MHSRLEAQLNSLANYAQCLSRDRENARDLVQSCVVKALTAKKVPSNQRAYRSWLHKILRNIFLDDLRKKATDDNILRELMENSDFDGNNQQESRVYTLEQRKINILSVHEGLQKLNVSQREILVLVDMAGFSYSEAANILQLPIGTVMSRLSRSRNALLREMDGINTGPVAVAATGKSK
ncbi:MAG: RNA polymerase sigma factor [Gammaproteobacteria bacterium]